MKKIIALLSLLIMCMPLFGCKDKNDISDVENKYETAMEYIADGNYEQAYKLLYLCREEDRAKEMLSKFNVTALKTSISERDVGDSITVYTVDNKGNLLTKIKKLNGITIEEEQNVYDANGNCVEHVYSDQWVNTVRSTYKYDNLNRQIEAITYQGNDANPYVRKYEYEYNENSDIVKLTTNENGTITIVESVYDDEYRLIKQTTTENDSVTIYEKTYDKDGNVLKNTTTVNGAVTDLEEYTYKDGNLIKTIINDNISGTIKTTENEYDSKNQLIKETYNRVDGNGEYSYVCEYKYDEHGNIIWKSYNAENNKLITEFTYNESGLISSETEKNSNEEITKKQIYIYDDEDRVIKYTVQENSKTSIYESEFDEFGNIVMERFLDDDGECSTTVYSDFVYTYKNNYKNDTDFDDQENSVDKLVSALDELESMVKLPYTIKFNFDDNRDQAIIEQRLVAMNCSIEERNSNGEYKIVSHHVITDEILNIICSNNSAVLVDQTDSIFMGKEDVISSKCSGTSLEAEISTEFFKNNEDSYYYKDFYIKTDKGRFPVYVLIESKSGTKTIDIFAKKHVNILKLNDDVKSVICLNIILASEPLNGKVEATIISQPN